MIRAAVLLVAALLACCNQSSITTTTSPAASSITPVSTSSSTVVVLLLDGRLQEIDFSSGRVVRELSLPDKPTPAYSGHYLASGLGGVFFALTERHVYKVAVATLSVVASAETPPGTTALAVGPVSGDVFLGGSTQVAVLDAASLRPLREPLSANGRYEVAVARDESRLYAGGHDNGYVQEFHINGTTISAGRQLENHGGFVPLPNGGLLTGDSSGVVLIYGLTSDQPQQADTTLGGHMMEYAASSQTAIVLGSCVYLGGLATVDLNSMAVKVVVPKHQPAGSAWAVPGSVCGERYFVVGDALVAIRPSQLSVISMRDGTVTGVVQLDAATDLLLLAD